MMAAMYPDTGESEAAELGTRAHDVAAALTTEAARTGYATLDRAACDLPDDYADAVEIAVAHAVAVMRECGVFGGPQLLVEQSLAAPTVHAANHGTPDLVVFNRDTGALHIVDYKFGRRYVPAHENWQLINYFAAVSDHYEINGYVDQHVTVTLTIVQPRAFAPDGVIRSWTVAAADLRPYVNQLRHAAAECFEPEPLLRSGPHCRDCSARLHCPVGLNAGLSIYESVMSGTGLDLTPHALGVQLLAVDRAYRDLDSLRDALQSEVEARTRQGVAVPHWRTEPATGRLTWTDDAQAIAMAAQLGVDIRSPKAITPRQAIDAGLDRAIVDAITTTPRNGWKVVADNDSKAKRVFSNDN